MDVYPTNSAAISRPECFAPTASCDFYGQTLSNRDATVAPTVTPHYLKKNRQHEKAREGRPLQGFFFNSEDGRKGSPYSSSDDDKCTDRRSSPVSREGSPPSGLGSEGHRSLSLKKRILQKVNEDIRSSSSNENTPGTSPRRESADEREEPSKEQECSWYYNPNDGEDVSLSPPRCLPEDAPDKFGDWQVDVDEFPEEDSEDSDETRGGESSWDPSEESKGEGEDEDDEDKVLMMCQKVVDEYDRADQTETAVYYLLDTLRNTRRTRPEVPKRCRFPENYPDIFRKLGKLSNNNFSLLLINL